MRADYTYAPQKHTGRAAQVEIFAESPAPKPPVVFIASHGAFYMLGGCIIMIEPTPHC